MKDRHVLIEVLVRPLDRVRVEDRALQGFDSRFRRSELDSVKDPIALVVRADQSADRNRLVPLEDHAVAVLDVFHSLILTQDQLVLCVHLGQRSTVFVITFVVSTRTIIAFVPSLFTGFTKFVDQLLHR